MVRIYNYDDFDLQIQRDGGKYRVQLLNSPSGQVTTELDLPFTNLEVNNFLSRIGQVQRRVRGSAGPELSAARDFGGKLFTSVFYGELLANFRSSVDRSSRLGKGLRIRLRLTDVPEIAELPWEFLYDAKLDVFWATSTETPIVRFPDLPQPIEPLQVALPLRLLVVIASPNTLPKLDAEGEWERLNGALGDLRKQGKLLVERLEKPTLDSLRLRARGEAFHIFHFIGHGDFDKKLEDGFLQFENNSGMAEPVPGWKLGMFLRDHRFLRVAVLNACEGARHSRLDPFSGVALSLLQQRVPAVIAMQFEISDNAAKIFAAEFYRAIADGCPVDAAVSECRKALFQDEHTQEWATPVLYMRTAEGTLFEMLHYSAVPETSTKTPMLAHKRGEVRPSWLSGSENQQFIKAQAHVLGTEQSSPNRQYKWAAIGLLLLVVSVCFLWLRRAQLHFANGLQSYVSKDYDRAINEFKAAIYSCYTLPEVYENLAAAYVQRGNELYDDNRSDEAIKEYRAAIDSRPSFPKAHHNLAVLLLEKNHDSINAWQESVMAFKQESVMAFKQDTDNIAIIIGFGNAAYERGDYAKARDMYDEAHRMAPPKSKDYCDSLNNLGVALLKDAVQIMPPGSIASEGSKAGEYLRRAIQALQDAAAASFDPDVHSNLEYAYYFKGDYSAANSEAQGLGILKAEGAPAVNLQMIPTGSHPLLRVRLAGPPQLKRKEARILR